jgi:hypothetical protein
VGKPGRGVFVFHCQTGFFVTVHYASPRPSTHLSAC